MPINHTSQLAALTDGQYAALGRFVAEWSNVEYLQGVVLSRLLRTPEYLGRTYVRHLSAARMQLAIAEAIDVHRCRYSTRFVSSTILDQIEAASATIGKLRTDRNKIAHFCWWRTNDDEFYGTNFAGGVPSPKSEARNSKALNLREIQRLSEQAYALTEQLIVIARSLDATPEPTWPKV